MVSVFFMYFTLRNINLLTPQSKITLGLNSESFIDFVYINTSSIGSEAFLCLLDFVACFV